MNKRNQPQMDLGIYEYFRPAWEWIKKNATTIAICFGLGFACGYNSSEMRVELDCKYAKSVRLNSNAFRCERII